MSEDDFDPFVALLDAAYALYGKSLSAEAKAMHFRALNAYSLPAVRGALEAHVKDPQRGQFAPKPADVIAQLEGEATHDGRPGPDEAWAMALNAQDEAATVVWTAEMAQAFGVARSVLERGDEVGARMAFKEVYKRRVDEARRQGQGVRWQASLGWAADLREQALGQAVATGRLLAGTAALLPQPKDHEADYDTEKARANLRRLHEQLAAMPSTWQRATAAREARRQAALSELEAKKRETAERVAHYRLDPSKRVA